MTHDEAEELLPVYALGALDTGVEELEAHISTCARCTAALASYRETTASLGEAVGAVPLPPSLRTAVLAHVPAPTRLWRLPRRMFSLPAAALLILTLGLAGGNVAQRLLLQSAQSKLALDENGLVLLTSTQTTVERLAPVVGPSTDAHGHWYHRPGVQTQVLVVEAMPAPPHGQSYVGWLQHTEGSWQMAGAFTRDEKGYGRIILVGSDGSDVRRVEVTRQADRSPTPAGELVLLWPAP